MDIPHSDAPKIRMRIVTRHDSHQLLSWRNQIKVGKFSKDNKEISSEEHTLWFTTRLKEMDQLGPIFVFEIEELAIGMTRLDRKSEREVEISILVSPTNQGKGVGKKMLDITIDYAFEVLKIPVVVAQIHLKNHTSLALFRRSGFQIFMERCHRFINI
jgi:RimJ/RimL family protein N-acetyltransferase